MRADATDFRPSLSKIRQARPDIVASNLAGNQITKFVEQYAEYSLQFPVVGFGFDTAVAWGAGKGNFSGIWPLVWHHLVDTPSSKKYVEAFHEEIRQAPRGPRAGADRLPSRSSPSRWSEINPADPQKLAEHLPQGREVRRR